MVYAWQIYLIGKLNTLIQLCVAMMTILATIGAWHCVLYFVAHGKEKFKELLRLARNYIIGVLVFMMLTFALPTTKLMLAMIVIPAIVNNKAVQQLPDLAIKAAKEWLNDAANQTKHN